MCIRDRSKAALTASGYTGEEIKLQFPNDNPVGGVEFTPVAERVQEFSYTQRGV